MFEFTEHCHFTSLGNYIDCLFLPPGPSLLRWVAFVTTQYYCSLGGYSCYGRPLKSNASSPCWLPVPETPVVRDKPQPLR